MINSTATWGTWINTHFKNLQCSVYFAAYVVNTCYTAHLMHGIRELSSFRSCLQPSCKAEQHSNFWTNLGQWDLQWNSLWTWVLCTCGAFDTCHLPNTAWRIQWWCVSHDSFNVCSVGLLNLSVCVWGVTGAGGGGWWLLLFLNCSNMFLDW